MSSKQIDNLLRIREKLPFKARKQIAEELGITYVTVYNTLTGKCRNNDVLKVALRLIEEDKELDAQMKEV